jgi:hypothetical protein
MRLSWQLILINARARFDVKRVELLFIQTALSESMGCSFKFILKVGLEESIVNAPLVRLHRKTQTTQKMRLDLNS